MKQISIIIPVYNAEKYIRECLKSIYGQGLQESSFEVIIVNDGSKDRSIDSIHDFIEKYRNLKIINQTNQGVSIARNNGLKAAQGTYVWFVDADDLLADNCLAKMLDIAEKNALDMLRITYINFEHSLDGKLNLLISPSFHTYVCKSGQEGFVENFNPAQGYIWQYIFRRKILIDNHLQFNQHLVFYEDWLFSVSALLAARNFISLSMQAYFYRQHEESAIHTLKKNAIQSLNIVIEQTCLLLAKTHLETNVKKKLLSCIFHLTILNFWLLTHNPTLYIQHKELISDLKNRVPRLSPGCSYREWKFSIYYNYCPFFYIWLKYHLQRKKLTRIFIRSS